MTRTRPSRGRPDRQRRRAFAIAAAIAAAIATTSVLSAFHTRLEAIDPAGADAASEVVGTEIVGIRTFTAPVGLRVEADLEYGAREDGTLLTLDVCLPSTAGLGIDLPAVVSVHGGSWARGDKANADWRNVCLWLASEGFVAASVNYRLVPDAVFPAQLDDVRLAVEWLRDPEQAARFGLDPARIGVFGGSAGGNLAALVGAAGEGPLDAGSRVAAVAELSGPVVLDGIADDDEWLRSIVGAYVDCLPDALDATACPAAREASAVTHLDPTDPPVFIGHAEHEIVPLVQSLGYAEALRAADVPVEVAVVPGAEHSIGILDAALREQVAAFLHAHLG